MSLIVKGCCGTTLRTAGILHGWIGIAILLLAISSSITRITKFDPDEITIYSNSFRPRTLEQEQITLGVYLIDFLISGLLLIGISKNNQYFLLPWLILRAIGLILAIPVCLLILFLSSYLFEPKMIIVALIYSFIICLFVWSYIVIYSLFEEIRAKGKKPMTNSSALPYYESQGGPLGPAPPYKVLDK